MSPPLCCRPTTGARVEQQPPAVAVTGPARCGGEGRAKGPQSRRTPTQRAIDRLTISINGEVDRGERHRSTAHSLPYSHELRRDLSPREAVPGPAEPHPHGADVHRVFRQVRPICQLRRRRPAEHGIREASHDGDHQHRSSVQSGIDVGAPEGPWPGVRTERLGSTREPGSGVRNAARHRPRRRAGRPTGPPAPLWSTGGARTWSRRRLSTAGCRCGSLRSLRTPSPWTERELWPTA
jgi:hypothetical protein